MMAHFHQQRILLWFGLVLLFTRTAEADLRNDNEEASFYGESYILTPVEDANSSTSISLDFRTHQPDGLLFLAAGDKDYIILQLNGGIVETRVNLGSGEAIVMSARGLRMDDSRWHELVVNRTLDTVYLTIDRISHGQGVTPGLYHDLNIDLGVYLGGWWKLKKDVYRDVKSFRGCLRDVYYNGMSVLQEAKDLKSAENVFQVAWHCDDEFFAGADSPISFSNPTSFVAFPYLRIYPSSDTTLSCEFKTRSSDGILLFNSGRGKAVEDFVAVELVDGRPKLSVDKGSGVIEVYLAETVSDGQWHHLEVSLSQTVALMQVDGLSNLTRFNLGGQNFLNLANNMFVGGIGFKARPMAIKLGLTSLQGEGAMKGSILGCVKNVKMNSRSYGFQQIQISRLIHPECGWDYPCANNPCLFNARCVEFEGTEFRCDCEHKVCVKDEFKSVSLDRNQDIDGVLSVQKLEATVRLENVIDESNVKLNSNILKYVSEETVMFSVVEQPKMGSIEIRNGVKTNSFTLKDLKMGRIIYRHNRGSVDFDSAVFQVSFDFDSVNQNVESKLKDKYEFVLPIHIGKRAVRVRPKLVLSRGNILNITSGARFVLSKSMLDVKDSMADPAKLTLEIKFRRISSSHFERLSAPGKSILSFTFKEMLDGGVWFVHGGDQIVYTTVAVTDGMTNSDIVDLRFKMNQLEITIVNNTGLLLDYGSSHLFSSHNLSAVTNMVIERLEILYHISRSVSHGAIQRLNIVTNKWMDVDSFTQDDINTGLIRYLHLPGETVAGYDELWLQAMAKDVRTSSFLFNIRFKTVTLYVNHEHDLILEQIQYERLTSTFLSVRSNSESLDFDKIVFTLHTPPRKGFLYFFKLKEVDLNRLQQVKPLSMDARFTQQDVNNGYIYYRVDRPNMEESEDFITLHASYFGYTVTVLLRIDYHPTKLEIQIINEGLHGVMEGGKKSITEDMLAVDIDDYSRYSFSLLRRPQHGAVNVIHPMTFATIRKNTSFFNMTEILDRQVIYVHDDSEHDSDSFTYSVVPLIGRSSIQGGEEIQEINGTFEIKINMQNDNAPIRTVNKVFHVVPGHTKHLTIEDLAFKDPDIDFDSSNLIYQTQAIPNGHLVRAFSREKVFNFTQRDLEEKNLIFQHSGKSYGRASFLVSDGKFFSKSFFEVKASDPYIVIVNNTGLVVRKGQSVALSSQSLSVESNVEFELHDVVFDVLEGPKFGYLRIRGREGKMFTYQDLKYGQVLYVNNNEESVEDYFRFSVTLDNTRNESDIYIKINFDDIDEPPEIFHNQILEVTAFHSETVRENYLSVGHKDYNDNEIEFIITKLPERGYLTVKGMKARKGSAPEFTQQDINEGLISYTSQSLEISFDSFIFDVNTNYQSLRNMEFLISVVPDSGQITNSNISVQEGRTATLELNKLSFNKRLIQNKGVTFIIDKVPLYGQILIKEGARQNPVRSFSVKSISQGRVLYQHDGSETLTDNFSIRVKSSNDVNIHQEVFVTVDIKPVNDQTPRVVVNTGLNVWTGSLTLLTNNSLKATDSDSGQNVVRFEVVAGPTNGHLAYLNNTFRPISSFTQDDIDHEQIVFIHKRANLGHFKFQATDGRNLGQVETFLIHSKQVGIILAKNKPIQVFPNVLQPISNLSLMAVTSSSNYTYPITYTLIQPFSTKGRLVTLKASRPKEIRTFTQEDINQKKIFYEHRSQMRSWEETDSIPVEISSIYATLLDQQVIPIQISFSNINSGNYKKLLGLKSPAIPEGTKVTISKDYFDATQFLQRIHSFQPNVKVEFTFASFVSHGSIWFKDMDAEVGGVFTQKELNNGDLVYNHDHTDSSEDMFQFAVKIMVPYQSSKGSSTSSNIFNFTVQILPINDQGFELLNRRPTIRVTQGLNVTVTSQILTTIDPDTGPIGIEYILFEQPDNGKFVKTSSPSLAIEKFTQKEIDDGSIVFQHDGSQHSGTTVKFKVWDGKFGPYLSFLNIEVMPIVIQISPDRGIPIVQGQKSVYLSNDQLRLHTNGRFMSLRYKVSQPSQFGQLYKRDVRVREFSQRDIEDGLIRYVQNPDSPGGDFFVCNIDLTYMDCSLDAVQFDIVVKPLIKQGPFLSSTGSHVAITRSSLDASELAQITNDNPHFKITEKPLYGHIVMKNRQRRSINGKSTFTPVSSFTFEDILYTKVYFIAESKSKGQDSFSYTLTAEGVPPAHGKFVIQLDPVDETTGKIDENTSNDKVESTMNTKKTVTNNKPLSTVMPEGKGGKTEEDDEVVKKATVQSGDDDDNSAMILAIVITSIILLILVIVLVVLFLRWRRRRRRANGDNDNPVKSRPYISGPLQLEQPHVFIEPHNDDSPAREEDTALMTPKSKEDFDEMYVNTSHINKSHDVHDTNPWLRTSNNAVCKTSPVFRNSGAEETPEDYESCSMVTSGRGSNASTDLMEWTLMDPDLLQHCYNSQPVLRNNQYWL